MKHTKKLVLLHSNDIHGDFLAEKIDDAYVGGVALLSGYVNKVREEEPNTLYCIAGDLFRGSVIDTEYKGISTIEIMNMLGPDVVTIGNHEADYGIAHILFLEKCALFPIVNANLYITTNHARLFESHYVAEVDGMKILFIGIITDEILAEAKKDRVLGSFVNVEDAADEVGRICDAYSSLDIDLTVLLTHIGHQKDKELAEKLDPAWGVDMIIGGHSHTYMEEPSVINGIPIVQAGMGTDQVGRFDIQIDTDSNCIDSYTWKCIPVDETTSCKDETLEHLIEKYKETTDKKYARILARFTRKMTHPSRYEETAVGDLFADIMAESTGVDLYLQASGALRNPEFGPVVTYEDLTNMYPFADRIMMVPLTGGQLMRIMHNMLCMAENPEGHSEFYQVSDGLEVVFDHQNHRFEKFDYKGQPLKEDTVLRVGIAEYHYLNLEKNTGVRLSAEQRGRVIATCDQDIAEEYLENNRITRRDVRGRIRVVNRE